METKKLELIFLDENSKKFTLSVDNPKSTIDEVEAKTAMNRIIEENIFIKKEKELKEISNARIVTRIIEDLI